MSSIGQDNKSQWEFDALKYWDFTKSDAENRLSDTWFGIYVTIQKMYLTHEIAAKRTADTASFSKATDLQKNQKSRSTNFHIPLYKLETTMLKTTVTKQQSQKINDMDVIHENNSSLAVAELGHEHRMPYSEEQMDNLSAISSQSSPNSRHVEHSTQYDQHRTQEDLLQKDDFAKSGTNKLPMAEDEREDILGVEDSIAGKSNISTQRNGFTARLAPDSSTKSASEGRKNKPLSTKDDVSKMNVFERLMKNTVASSSKFRPSHAKEPVSRKHVPKNVAREINARIWNPPKRPKLQTGRPVLSRATAPTAASAMKTNIPLNEQHKNHKTTLHSGHKKPHHSTASITKHPASSLARSNKASHRSRIATAETHNERSEHANIHPRNQLQMVSSIPQPDFTRRLEKTLPSHSGKDHPIRQSQKDDSLKLSDSILLHQRSNGRDASDVRSKQAKRSTNDWGASWRQQSKLTVNTGVSHPSNALTTATRHKEKTEEKYAQYSTSTVRHSSASIRTAHIVSNKQVNENERAELVDERRPEDSEKTDEDYKKTDFDGLLKRMKHIRSQLQEVSEHKIAPSAAVSRTNIVSSNLSIEDKIKRARHVIAESKRRSKRWPGAVKDDIPADNTSDHARQNLIYHSNEPTNRFSASRPVADKMTDTSLGFFYYNRRKRPKVFKSKFLPVEPTVPKSPIFSTDRRMKTTR
ncbi:hypothetical protein DFQ28_007779 [Apophysomyces sp. BC1034]|nr:hypothetical protein DFQ30_007638 [Apophysomyces sp. BC1015]KAG0176093.1 hypothetical protein DFQ29_006555 [Apophysomyces sp. BC1021]KAG0186431.1 hypothetical protein DFQ28_007779 [Apophysomyces sp. BC1034]